jgi:hypothetical protein
MEKNESQAYQSPADQALANANLEHEKLLQKLDNKEIFSPSPPEPTNPADVAPELALAFCALVPQIAWKLKPLPEDSHFRFGIRQNKGRQISFVLPMAYYEDCQAKEISEIDLDGHEPHDVRKRLLDIH